MTTICHGKGDLDEPSRNEVHTECATAEAPILAAHSPLHFLFPGSSNSAAQRHGFTSFNLQEPITPSIPFISILVQNKIILIRDGE